LGKPNILITQLSIINYQLSIKTMTSSTPPIYRSPVTWVLVLLTIGILFQTVSYKTARRVVSLLFSDVSQSNQVNRAAVTKICRDRLERLLEDDPIIDGKFSDRVEIVNNATYGSNYHLDCDRSAISPPGLGKQPGTDLAAALSSMNDAIEHQRVLGTSGKVAAILVIQAAEPTAGKKPIDSQTLVTAVQKITKQGFLTIIGPETILQGQLNQTFANVPNLKVCSFSQAKACGIDWVFDRARK
jgi:hypothetical protein